MIQIPGGHFKPSAEDFWEKKSKENLYFFFNNYIQFQKLTIIMKLSLTWQVVIQEKDALEYLVIIVYLFPDLVTRILALSCMRGSKISDSSSNLNKASIGAMSLIQFHLWMGPRSSHSRVPKSWLYLIAISSGRPKTQKKVYETYNIGLKIRNFLDDISYQLPAWDL